MTTQTLPDAFDRLKIATEDEFFHSTKPKVTASTTEKEETDNKKAIVETKNNADVKYPFTDIPIDFLNNLEEIFNQSNITNFQAHSNFHMPLDVLTNNLVAKGTKNELVSDLLRQWRNALLEVIQQEKRIREELELKMQSRRPLWRCSVCGRPSNPGCPVAPYIYGYQDINTGEKFQFQTS